MGRREVNHEKKVIYIYKRIKEVIKETKTAKQKRIGQVRKKFNRIKGERTFSRIKKRTKGKKINLDERKY